MNRARRFATNDPNDLGMGVAETVDGDATQKIEIFLAGGVEDVRTAAVGEDERLALVGGEKVFLRVGESGRRNSLANWFGAFHGLCGTDGDRMRFAKNTRAGDRIIRN